MSGGDNTNGKKILSSSSQLLVGTNGTVAVGTTIGADDSLHSRILSTSLHNSKRGHFDLPDLRCMPWV